MGHIFRYVSADKVVSAASADVKPGVQVETGTGSQCNYPDNYYGDQLCLSCPVR